MATDTMERAIKIDEAFRLVIGVAMVTGEVDGHGDIVDERELTKAAMRSLGADVKVDHAGASVGRVCMSLALTPDVARALGVTMPDASQSVWVVGLYVEDPATWAKIKSGALGAGLSIGGKVRRTAA